jgi:hypothetical protein
MVGREGRKKNLKVDKFTKFQKFCMHIFIKFFIALFNLFICKLEDVIGKLISPNDIYIYIYEINHSAATFMIYEVNTIENPKGKNR